MKDQIQILGNKVDCFSDYRSFYNYILLNRKGKNGYITVNNVHTMIEGFRNRQFQAIINNSFLSIPDGKPLEIVGRLKGNNRISRLFGPTTMEKFIDWGREDNIKHFFIGSSDLTLKKLKLTIDNKYPGAIIAGLVSPPYKPIDQWDNTELIKQINSCKPDFVWVGLGAPKQELWMSQFHNYITEGILIGIGAGFDYMAGNTKHAPIWMKQASLEWLYRLIQEPRRLWRRYFNTIPPFILFASLELLKINFRNKSK